MMRIPTPFGPQSTSEVAQGIDFSRKWTLVTGAVSDIGVETLLVCTEAEVTLAVRNTEALTLNPTLSRQHRYYRSFNVPIN